jgi:hypothetical protein
MLLLGAGLGWRGVQSLDENAVGVVGDECDREDEVIVHVHVLGVLGILLGVLVLGVRSSKSSASWSSASSASGSQ